LHSSIHSPVPSAFVLALKSLKCRPGFTGHGQKDAVLQFPPEMTIQAGHSAALHCNFSTSDPYAYIFWYQQCLTQSPEMLLCVDRCRPCVDSGRFSCLLRAHKCFCMCRMPSSRTVLSLCSEPTPVCTLCNTAQKGLWSALGSGSVLATICVKP
uniref:Ig-like domain-containing protein n=1 Tax=Dromaius novaehollandiae TaxID=8790 RepID=A0A8C4JZ54_DRONO